MAVSNIQTLRDDLVKTYDNIGIEGGISINTARAKSNIASNIINSLRVELAERIRTKNDSQIEFLKTNN